jgi:hypothetical protein
MYILSPQLRDVPGTCIVVQKVLTFAPHIYRY